MEDDAEMGDSRSLQAAIRSAKKSAQPSKIGVPERRPSKASKVKGRKTPKKSPRSFGAFDNDLGQRAHEGARSKKGVSAGTGRKGPKRKGK